MKKILIGAVVVIVAAVAIAHWYFSDRGRFTTAPQYTELGREVDGNVIRSTYDPPVMLTFADEFGFVGGQQFILYGVADTEQYFFVEADEQNQLRSVYWVQFEAYLPEKNYSYNYDDSPLRVQLGEYEFFTDTEFFEFDPDKKRRRGTDGAMARQLLAQHGFSWPRQVAYARMVYLTDDARNKELMIIFMDDLSRYGVTADQIGADGPASARRPQIEQALLQRIQETLKAVPLPTDSP
ncbi:MAG: hypothetical protein KJO55_00305 [Gammaproteobacteria bacterium]|nr:hypothetical protein [Gammaproteobacteria bacterium]NND60493.1 hypothetical protein [Gammaproteobacteria bacterium]